MKHTMLFAALFVTIQSVQAQIVDREIYLREFKQRATLVTSVYDTMQTAGYYQAAVRYARNHDLAVADSMFIAMLREPRGDIFRK